MQTKIISLSVSNLDTFDDEKIINEYFTSKDWVDVITINVIDRNIIISGNNVTHEMVIKSLDELGYKVV